MSEQVRCDFCDAKPPRPSGEGVASPWMTYRRYHHMSLGEERLDFCDWRCTAAYMAARRDEHDARA